MISVNTPDDLRRLPIDSLPELCEDIRKYMISNLSRNPGHFASSMGAVEIAVALHYVYNTPRDRIVWDVGHQAYAHKILTGRRELFENQRTLTGISGFPNPAESEYDTFIAGHAGNSISAALGMSIADQLTPGEEDRKTVAVIGDASISNGLAFEGLNNASNQPNNLLIILNDNDMSIDNNVGALHRYLSRITTSARYNKWRNRLYNKFKAHGLMNDKRKGLLIRFNNSIKSLISRKQNIFEGLNIRYFGPFDGNNINEIIKVLSEIKEMKGPRILHLCTRKGKGYPSAEENPQDWHAPGRFNPDTGKKLNVQGPLPWQEVFGQTLVELARNNESIVGITAAMPSGTSIARMLEIFPERTYDVGISEGHAVTFAGGLASAGKKPFVAIYSSFLQRAYDNIIHDVAIQGLPVTFCIDRAGIVGEDGVTHHGLFDLAYLSVIPNLVIASPRNAVMLRNLMKTAEEYNGPFAIRYPRGGSDVMVLPEEIKKIDIGKGEQIYQSPIDNNRGKVAILAIGPICSDAIRVAEEMKNENIPVNVYDMIWTKPFDEELLSKICDNHPVVITIEDGVIKGGFGSAIAEWLVSHNISIKFKSMGVPDIWIKHGKIGELRKLAGYDRESLKNIIKEIYATL